MAPLVTGPDEPPAVVLSTDAIREEIHGDSAVQGDWDLIEAQLHERLKQAVRDGVSVIVDATHAYRPWRLALTQGLTMPRPVEWVGWQLTTPLDTCKAWNETRRSTVPEGVIDRYHRALRHRHFKPSAAEGLACLVQLDPSLLPAGERNEALQKEIRSQLKRLPKRISGSRNRTKDYELHGYSRLLDMERLLYLLSLLSRFPGLETFDERSSTELRRLCDPLPLSDDLAQRAAALLSGHGECYADVEALRTDLAWLQEQGFATGSSVRTPVESPPASPELVLHQGGWPPTADRLAFQRVMTLLRHVLQNPFDHDRKSAHDQKPGNPLAVHLIQQMQDIPGAYLGGPIITTEIPKNTAGRKKTAGTGKTVDSEKKEVRKKCGESQTLQNDVDNLWTAYGFRQPEDARHGYTLGTALLTAPRLVELHHLVRQTALRLEDPSAQDLKKEFDERMRWAGLEVDNLEPVRAYANRSIVGTEHVPEDSLAVAAQAEKLEAAILNGERVMLERYSGAARFDDRPQITETLRVWPLQLLFHNIGWYLAFEEDNAGQPGLIRTERLDRLRWVRVERTGRDARQPEQRRPSMKRLQQLLKYCSGIFFGDDLHAQLDLCSDDPAVRNRPLRTLRIRCEDWVFNFLREGVQRFPAELTRLSKPLPTDTWKHRPNISASLEPIPDDSHPYPVEIDMPYWTVEKDVDLKRWIFGFGPGVVVEAPEVLRQKRLDEARKVLANSSVDVSPQA